MKRPLAVLVLVACSSASGQIPTLINYQGRLISGTNLVNGTVSLSLRLFSNSVPAVGETLLYEDSNSVTVADGLYSTFLGDNTTVGSLNNTLTNANLNIEVMVNGVALSPRERISSVAYALVAGGMPPGTITSAMIADGAIRTNDLANNSISSNAIAAGAVGAGELGTNAIHSSNIEDVQITAEKMVNSLTSISMQSVTNPSPDADDNFGWAVAGNGPDNFVVGAPNDDTSGANAGVVYRYDLNRQLVGVITNPAPAANDAFGFALAEFGTIGSFAVGAPGRDAGAIQTSGVVYVYSSSGSVSSEIVNPTPGVNDRFGSSLAGFGSFVLVGAPLDDQGAVDAGAAYLFNAGGTLSGAYTNPSPAVGDNFGQGLCQLSNTVLVGAPGKDIGATNAGVVYMFSQSGTLLMTITNPSPNAGDLFGYSLAPAGSDKFVVGAPATNGAGNSAAYLYNSAGALIASQNGGSSNALGLCAAAFGPDKVIVGEPLSSSVSQGTNSGTFKIFTSLLGTIGLGGSFGNTSTNDELGFSVASVGLRGVLVGSPFSNVGANNAGRVFFDQLDFYVEGLIADSVREGSVGLDQLNVSDVDTRYVNESGDTMTGPLGIRTTNQTVSLTVAGAGVFNNANAAAIVLDNTSANGRRWEWHSLDDGRMQLVDFDAAATRLIIATNGFVGIGTSSPTNALQVVGNVQATAYITTSDRNAKDHIVPVSAEEVLAKVSTLPISTWTFKEESSGTHMGPMAQDFKAAFGLGNTDSGIYTVDADGVSLAAIQALYRLVQEQQKRIEELERKLDERAPPGLD